MNLPRWARWMLARFFHLRGATHRHFGNSTGDLAEQEFAVADFTRAIELDPDYVSAYYDRGVLYWRELRNGQRAIRDLTRVRELAPAWAEALFNRAMAHQILGDHEKAIADLEQYLVEGKDEYWRASAQRQMSTLREMAREVARDAQRASTG